MNRRELIKALAAVGVSLPVLLRDSAYAQTPAQSLYVNAASAGLRYMNSFAASGYLKRSEHRLIDIQRANGKSLLQFDINAFGGMLSWIAPLGLQIIFLGDETPKIKCLHGVDFSTVLYDDHDKTRTIVMGRYRNKRYQVPLYSPEFVEIEDVL